jgi:hypothetical protein
MGIDTVPSIIAKRRAESTDSREEFQRLDEVSADLPRADAILCRDTLVHLPYELALQVMANFKRPGSRLLIATTYPGRTKNTDIKLGSWRALNMALAPFNFPEPLEILSEDSKLDGDKSLGMWRLAIL